MAIALADNDFLECKLWCTAGNQLGLMVFHGEYKEAIPTINLEDVAFALDAAFAGPLIAVLSDQATYQGASVRRITPSPTVEVYDATSRGPGLVAGDVMSRQTAGIITLQTDSPGARNRGRKYVPFPSEADNTLTGHPDAATYLPPLFTLASLWTVPLMLALISGSGQVNWVIYHRDLGTFTRITRVRVNEKWATQRRRSDYGRPNVIPF